MIDDWWKTKFKCNPVSVNQGGYNEEKIEYNKNVEKYNLKDGYFVLVNRG